jgi:hypothetical protein
MTITSLAFLTPGNFADDDPYTGLPHAELLGGPHTVIESPGNIQRPRLQPHNPGLVNRIWYGGGSLRSARRHGESGLNLLCGNIDTGDFTTARSNLLASCPHPRPAGPETDTVRTRTGPAPSAMGGGAMTTGGPVASCRYGGGRWAGLRRTGSGGRPN